MIRLVYKDGTTEEVERCLKVETKQKDGTWKLKWAAQRNRRSKIKWIDPKLVTNVQWMLDDLPEPWRPSQA